MRFSMPAAVQQQQVEEVANDAYQVTSFTDNDQSEVPPLLSQSSNSKIATMQQSNRIENQRAPKESITKLDLSKVIKDQAHQPSTYSGHRSASGGLMFEQINYDKNASTKLLQDSTAINEHDTTGQKSTANK